MSKRNLLTALFLATAFAASGCGPDDDFDGATKIRQSERALTEQCQAAPCRDACQDLGFEWGFCTDNVTCECWNPTQPPGPGHVPGEGGHHGVTCVRAQDRGFRDVGFICYPSI